MKEIEKASDIGIRKGQKSTPALCSLMSPPHISDGSQQIMCFIFILLGSLLHPSQSQKYMYMYF